MKLIICPVEKTANHHDCWLYHKPTKRLFYVPFGHHYQLFDYLMQHGYGDVMAGEWNGKSDNKHIKTGDIKHGMPRTVNENILTHKVLSNVIMQTYNSVRNILPTEETVYELGKQNIIISFMENEKPKTPKNPPPKLNNFTNAVQPKPEIDILPQDLKPGDIFSGWGTHHQFKVMAIGPGIVSFEKVIPVPGLLNSYCYCYGDMTHLKIILKAESQI